MALNTLTRWIKRRLTSPSTSDEMGKFSDYAPPTGSRQEIFYYQTMGVSKIKILTKEDEEVCDTCRELNGKVFSFKEYREELPLPASTCTGKSCRCYTVPVL